jgi:hypothetical protein
LHFFSARSISVLSQVFSIAILADLKSGKVPGSHPRRRSHICDAASTGCTYACNPLPQRRFNVYISTSPKLPRQRQNIDS